MLTKDDITVDEEREIITIAKPGRGRIVVDLKNETVTLDALGDLSIYADGKIDMRAEKGIEIATPEELVISGKIVRIN